MYRITLIPGDGIGPEVITAARRVIDATGVNIQWEEAVAGQSAIPEYGEPVPEATLESIRRNRVALKGPLTNIVGSGFRSPNVTLRTRLDLYANVRHAKYYPGVRSQFNNVDLVVIRENTEDTYCGLEQMVGADSAVALKFITRKGSERIIRFAFEYAQREERQKVTVAVKANILKLTDGMFLRVAREVATDYPDIEFEEVIIDALCMKLVQKPEEFDVLVMPNVYGDLIADLAAGLAGGLGVGPGANFGNGIAVFESVHGSAPKYAGLNKVNPAAMILSGAMMLKHLGEGEAAVRIEKAVKEVIAAGKEVTYDLGGTAGTSAMAEAIIAAMN